MSTVEKYYNEFYAEIAELDAKGNDFSKIQTILPELSGNETFLDIGSGYGTVTEELIKRGFKVYAVEINKKAIDILRERGFIVYERDITKPLSINEKFDVVLLLDVLEHVFDPLFLLNEAKSVTKPEGYIIITVPLYFDILDRLKILFTGSVISMDNLVYGEKIYKKFRSYNYDHIRFFRPKEVLEMGELLGLKVEKIEYVPTSYFGKSKLLKLLTKLIANKYTVKLNPNLLAHSMRVRWRVK
jgi:2-polyprenyl-3-methyl-5-hydroxy-6-metoxy-1,4-benzoquinol methylase